MPENGGCYWLPGGGLWLSVNGWRFSSRLYPLPAADLLRIKDIHRNGKRFVLPVKNAMNRRPGILYWQNIKDQARSNFIKFNRTAKYLLLTEFQEN